ncbi:MAG: hypothetical protein K5765_05285 [Clostridia bacterium]|nr:hypothetical protein [Clostridia bacterium]
MFKTNKQKKIFIICICVAIVVIALSLTIYFVIQANFHHNETIIPTQVRFECPDYKNQGTTTNDSAVGLFSEAINNLDNWYYVGTLSGTCSFSEDDDSEIVNHGIEIVKCYDNEYFSTIQTNSKGNIPGGVNEINVNSAKKYHYVNDTLYSCEIKDNNRFLEGEDRIDWSKLKYENVTNADGIINELKNTVQFIVTEDIIINPDDALVYSLNNKKYVEFNIDVSKYEIDELLDILSGKLSTTVMNIGKTIVSLPNMTTDMSELKATMTFEFSEIDNKLQITGRDFHLFGSADFKGKILSYKISMDLYMRAVIFYDNNLCKITKEEIELK